MSLSSYIRDFAATWLAARTIGAAAPHADPRLADATGPEAQDFMGKLTEADVIGTIRSMAMDQRTPLSFYTTQQATPEIMRRIFAPAPPMPGVVPEGETPMAMDDLLSGEMWASYAGTAGRYTENLQWLGIPYLSELAQRAEYRKISETIAREMTRRWFKLQATGDDDKSDKIIALNAAMDRHKLQAKFRRIAELDGFFGRAHLYIDTGLTNDKDSLKVPLAIDPRIIRKGKDLKGFRVIEPVWTYPNVYNSIDPMAHDFYLPQTWYVMAKQIHRTRLLTFVAREVPDLFKPAYQFGGISMSQLARDYVNNWLRTRQSVSDMVHSFSTPVLLSNLGAALNAGVDKQMRLRALLFNYLRDNNNLLMLDKATEDFKNVSAPLGSVDHLQAQAQEQIASVCGIPLVVLLGIQPSGLNASSEGELRTWAQYIHAAQTAFFDDNLILVLRILQLDLFGEIDPEITHAWEPLEELDASERATAEKTQADTDAVYVNAGVLSPDEIRQRLSNEEDSPYQGLDLESPAPTPPEEEQDPGAGGAEPPQGGPGKPPGGGQGAGGPGVAGGGTSAPVSAQKPVRGVLGKPIGGGTDDAEGQTVDPPAAANDPSKPAPADPNVEHTRIKLEEGRDVAHIHVGPTDHVHIKLAEARQAREPKDDGFGTIQPARKLAADAAPWEEEKHTRGEGGKFAKSKSYSKANPPKESHLNGVAFGSWKAPTSSEGWQAEADAGPKFEEPELPPLKGGRRQGAGVIVQEPDGATWVIRPKNAYGGYKASFPKGGVDEGDSLHSTAIKEAYEESGLHVQLTGFAGDAMRDTSQARYYYAKRIGGTPADHGWETEGVTLAPANELHQHLNKPIDRAIARATIPGAKHEAPLNIAGMQKSGGQLGSNPGGKYHDPDTGKDFYVKQSKSNDHAKNEILAARLYEAAQAPILHQMPVDLGGGKLGTASEWQKSQPINPASKGDRQSSQKHFAAHAWLANWDAAGLVHDNQARIDGRMHTLDGGGSLLYRAQGGPKGAAFGDQVGEFESMRHPVAGLPDNVQAHELFGEMTPDQLRESAARVTKIPDHVIHGLVQEHGPGTVPQKEALANRLIARRDDIAKRVAALPKPAPSPYQESGGHYTGHDAALAADEAMFTPEFAAALDAMIGEEWDEGAHPRDEGGKFTSGGGAAKGNKDLEEPALPAHPAHKKPAAAIQQLLQAAKEDPNLADQAAKEIKDISKNYTATSVVAYANKSLKHLEGWHGLAPGSLGKAEKKGLFAGKGGKPGVTPEIGALAAPSAAEMEKMAAAAGAEMADNPYIATIATMAHTTHAEKVAALNSIIGNPALSVGEHNQAKAELAKLGNEPEPEWLKTLFPEQVERETPPHIANLDQPALPANATPTQQTIHQVGSGENTIAKKKALIKDIAAGQSQKDQFYAEMWLDHLSTQTDAPEAEEPAAEAGWPAATAQWQQNYLQFAQDPNMASGKKLETLEHIKQGFPSYAPFVQQLIDKVKGGETPGEALKAKAQVDAATAMSVIGKVAASPTMSSADKIKFIQNAEVPPGEAENFKNDWLKALGAAGKPAKPDPDKQPWLKPHPDSKHQGNIYKLATQDPPDLQGIKDYPTVKEYPDGFTAKYANSWIKAHGGEPIPGVGFAEPGAPPVPKPPPPPEKGTLAQKAAQAAPKTPKHGSLTAPANAQVTQARKGPQLSFALKAESEAHNPKSTSDALSHELVPSMNSSFWTEQAKKDQAAFSSYGGGGYSDINGVLRGHEPPTPETLKKIDAMHAIMEAPEVRTTGDKPLRLIRGEGMSDAAIKDIKTQLEKNIGTVPYMRTGFSSASIGPTPGYHAEKNVWWQFTVMPGAKVLGLAGHVGHHEREVVLPHGISTEIYEMYHDGKRHIIKAIVR